LTADSAAEALTGPMLVSGAILVGAYGLIFGEVLHRTIAATLGAVLMVAAGIAGGFYSQEDAIKAIDANTMLLLTGMMMVVAMLRPTGGFDYLAIRIAKLAAASPRLLLVYIGLAVSVVSMFLDNVTTVIIFAPLTVLITRILDLNPMPYLMGEAMLSNIGGIATLVGDPPNIMIGSAAHIDFNQFLFHMGPIVSVAWACTTGLLLFVFRHELRPSPTFTAEVDLDESQAIRDLSTLKKVLLALAIIIALFFVHHHLHLYPAYVTFIGVALALVLLRPDPEVVLREVEWPVLLFFAALFVIVGGVDGSGLLALIGRKLAQFAERPELLVATSLALMWIAAVLSAVVDNIPFTVTMIPIVLSLESQGANVTPLWWALALGVGLGGNGTHIGATANIICVVESERCGIPAACITPRIWLRKGLPTMLFSLAVTSTMFALFFGFFS
jgi:Na+/H+ antiporter NhaD/arsenite permease-like protein